MRTIKLTLAYDGTAYAGWQFQPEHPTIQATLERVIARITGETLRVTGSGRTDAGVHAIGQVASFCTNSTLEVAVLQRAFNAFLPNDVVVLKVEDAPATFHAIRDSKRKRYRYVIDDGPTADVFARTYAWRSWRRLDVDAMHRASQALLGTHDFKSFETAGSERSTTIRTVFDVLVRRVDRAGHVHIEIEADGFLYNMVRTIAGSLSLIGKAAKPENWLHEVLHATDRRVAGPTAPPQGLFLVNVDYGTSSERASEQPSNSAASTV